MPNPAEGGRVERLSKGARDVRVPTSNKVGKGIWMQRPGPAEPLARPAGTRASAADQEVSSAHILLLSDEILGRSVEIERIGAVLPGTGEPGGGSLALSDPNAGTDGVFAVGENSRSGMGDGTNPGLGDGMEHSPNEGTANANQAPR